MHRLKNHLILGAVFALLVTIGSIMNLHQAEAQGPPNGLAVNIVNPVPVPVTGSTTVSGAVAATQSGAWNVGLAAGATVLTKGLDEPGRSPYQEALSGLININFCATAECDVDLTFSAVPPGKRLVITDFFASFNVLTGASVLAATLQIPGFSVDLPISFQSQRKATLTGVEQWSSHQHLHVFVEQSQSPQVFLAVDPAHVSSEKSFIALSGYYVSLP